MLFQRSLSRASLGMLSPRADTTLKAGDVSLVDTPGSGRGDQSDTLGNLASTRENFLIQTKRGQFLRGIWAEVQTMKLIDYLHFILGHAFALS
jgi:hypothetical protein